MKYLTITTKRIIPDNQWEDYKEQTMFLEIDYNKLEREGTLKIDTHEEGEQVETIYELTNK